MTRREEFHALLKDILGSDHVYFQPPESFKLAYPAIVYELSDIYSRPADNIVYSTMHEYMLTYIDKLPDCPIVDELSQLPLCRFNRSYKCDNLNHYVFIIYY